MDTGYVLLACGFVALAIAVNLWGRGRSFRVWVTKDLRRGDLHALAIAARGKCFEIDHAQIDRLRGRGFVRKGPMNGFRVTMKGRVALALRATVAKDTRFRQSLIP